MRKGRFDKPAAKIARRYSESVSIDWRLYRHDIAGSIAHAAALAQAGILTSQERETGCWSQDGYGGAFGTACATLVLQIPYRYLPIFQD